MNVSTFDARAGDPEISTGHETGTRPLYILILNNIFYTPRTDTVLLLVKLRAQFLFENEEKLERKTTSVT